MTDETEMCDLYACASYDTFVFFFLSRVSGYPSCAPILLLSFFLFLFFFYFLFYFIYIFFIVTILDLDYNDPAKTCSQEFSTVEIKSAGNLLIDYHRRTAYPLAPIRT